jgi:dihydroorotate dehydrogenase electron transfer subunit
MHGKITKNTQIKTGYYLLAVKLSEAFKTPVPGQFVMVREEGRSYPLLGRPFSVYSIDRRKGTVIVEILYKVVGKGTVFLSRLKRGDLLEIFGPYGRGFEIFPQVGKIVLICGGIGVAPIAFLASHYRSLVDIRNVELICYYGAKSTENLVGLENIKGFCSNVFISTDDGSIGYNGFVTEMFKDDMSSHNPEITKIYACGHRPMLKRLSELLAGNHLSCQVLIEERMACGIGACLGCAVRTNDKEGEGTYLRARKDGPVFNIKDIAWD